MSHLPAITAPSFEQHPTGFGVGVACPRLSWRFLAGDNSTQNWEQFAYDIEVARAKDMPEDVYHVNSNASVLVPWPSKPLKSREAAHVRVRAYGGARGATGDAHEPTAWSPWTTVECALLQRKDWEAVVIGSSQKDGSGGPLRPMRFRKTFALPSNEGGYDKARLYITSLGVYHVYINGRRVGDECMAPGWTSYHYHLNYQVFDVASLLKPNELNVIAAEVGEGWYAGRLGFLGGTRYLYGDDLGLLAQLEVGRRDGSRVFTLNTDTSWMASPSAIIRSEIYDGEIFDARQEDPNWVASSSADDASGKPVRALEFPHAMLMASDAPPVRVIEEVQPVKIIRTPSNKTIIDFGQNLVGRLLVRSLDKPKGHSVTFQHAEVLEGGELGVRPLRVAKCTDEVICSGALLVDWSPKFSFHGFRYVQVNGWSTTDEDDSLQLSKISAVVLHTDMTRTGWFSCSNSMVNRLHRNAVWSMRGNFVSLPTDCPQRDERLGWTGDIQIFCPSANFLYHTPGLLDGWLRDYAAEQLEDPENPIPPFVVPNAIPERLWPKVPQAVWDDATVLAPWALYRSYGDKEILRRQYPSMVAWVDKGIRRGPDGLWDPDLWQMGDWLDPAAPPVEPGDARTSGVLVADAYLVHVTGVIAQVSEVLGKDDDAACYSDHARRLKAAFQFKYIAPSGLLTSDSQTALSLAIMYDLHDSSEQVGTAAARLAQLVRAAKFRVATGFAGTPLVTHALSKGGKHQIAYRMLLEKGVPSWMYPITMGATTVWERWDSMLPDGTINPGEMTSFNHYALGSVINWLHETVAGVSPIEPGWKTIRVKPVPGGNITSAEAVYETPYGRLECRWNIEHDNRFTLELLIPHNTRALVVLPIEGEDRTPGNSEDEKWIGSGPYTFTCRFSNLTDWPPSSIIPIMRTGEIDQIAE